MIRTKPNSCYDTSKLYKPEWAYPNPPGMRAESFILPFSFQVVANGQIQENFPWKLDDDVPWVFRGMVFPQIGTGEAVNSPAYNVGNPGLVRIRDTYGNPLTNCPQTQDLVLAMGSIGQSGFNSINAFGFPFGCEAYCERGGVILFDFQLPSNAVAATLLVVAGVLITAVTLGASGNNITVEFDDTGVPGTPLSVAVVGNAITVTLEDDGGGIAISTYGDIAAAIAASPAASALVTMSVSEGEFNVVANTFSATNLVAGAGSGFQTVQGTMLGAKLFLDC